MNVFKQRNELHGLIYRPCSIVMRSRRYMLRLVNLGLHLFKGGVAACYVLQSPRPAINRV
jgi:hypothetical protein